MTDLHEKLAQVIEDNYDCNRHREVTNCSGIADAIIAALPDLPPELEWKFSPESTTWAKASYTSLNYVIEHRQHGHYFDLWIGYNSVNAKRFDSLEAAKAAANEHHRAALMAGLGVK